MKHVEDSKLVLQAKLGNAEAFAGLVRKYGEAVKGYCYYRTGNFEDARDLCQETFIIAYTKLHQLRESSKFGAWIRKIAANACARFLSSKSETCHVGGHFDVVEREISPAQQEEWWEQPSGIGPQRLFMSMFDGSSGFTLINKGIPQYEATSDGTVYLTLLKSVSHLARYYMPQWRTGGMNFPVLATPTAQEPGEHTFQYSVYPHNGNWQSAGSHLQAMSFNAGMRVMQTGSHGGELPDHLSFVNVSPSELVMSAVNKSAKEDGLIVRFYNSCGRSVTGSISLFREFKQVYKVNLLEKAVEQDALQPIDARSLEITVNPYEIVTLKFMF